MKFLKFLKFGNENPEVASISDKDMNSLVAMCYKCDPKVVKKGIITKSYAYYVPQRETDLNVIKEIFVRNGIPMQEHFSYILGFWKQMVLRVDYRDVKNPDKLKQEMKKIKANVDAWYVFDECTEMKQKQR